MPRLFTVCGLCSRCFHASPQEQGEQGACVHCCRGLQKHEAFSQSNLIASLHALLLCELDCL